MADLIGTATIRVNMGTATAVRSIRRMVSQSEGPLRTLQQRIAAASSELSGLQGTSVAVTVDDRTEAGAAAVRAAVRDLQRLGPVQINARLDAELTDIEATATALRGLQDAARGTSRTLATLTTRATTAAAALTALGAAARSLRGDIDDLDGSIRRTGGGMTALRGRLDTITNSASSAGSSMDTLKSATLLLAPALIPIALQAAPIAASLTAATMAVGAFAAAAGGQISAMSEAADAEKKYKDAVAEHGATSKQAADAQAAYVRQVEKMPPATRTAAAALSAFKDGYRQWSDALAADTMPVVTKSFAVFGALFPKLTPVVQGASAQLNPFVAIAAGGIQSSGFDRFMRSFAEFSTGAMAKANDSLIRFTRTLDTGKISGGVNEFMEYVRANGPMVRDTLASVVQALSNVLQGAADVGPGLLAVVNALAGLVAAVPPGVITAMLQLALAIKAVKLAAAGMAAATGGMAALSAAVGGMRTAAAGATGVLPRLGAAFMALSRTVRVAVAGTGIGLLLIALTELSQRSRQAPPDVDKLTGSLSQLGRMGKVTGEAAKAFGTDLDGLYGKVRSLTDPSTTDKVQQFLVGWTGWDSTPVKDAKENLGAVDEALANLVKNNQADLAAAAVKRLTAEYGKGGRDTSEFTNRLTEYKASLEDAKFEQMLAADAMSLFGQQAQATSAKLAEQKASADGLRQAIAALNEVNRAGLTGMIGFEAAIDAASKAAADNAGVLSMQGGQLTLNTEKQRTAAQALNDLAAKTDEAAASARDNGQSWASVNGIYERGRQELIANAQAMGLTAGQARQLADQILKVPSGKKITLEMRTQDAVNGLNGVIDAIKKAPNSKSVTVKALTSDAVSLLRELGFKVKQMPDGRFKVTAETGTAKANLAAVQRARDNLKSKTIDLAARDRASQQARAIQRAIDSVRGKTVDIYTVRHTINVEATAARNAKNYRARGGPIGLAGGGSPGGPVFGPGSSTSDSIPAMLSNGEYVINARSTAKYRGLIEAINAGSLGAGSVGMAGGGMAAAGADAGRGLAAGITGSASLVTAAARAMASAVASGVRQELQIASPSKKLQKIGKDTGAGFIKGLTGTKAQINSAAKSMASAITNAFKGTGSRTDDRLVRMLTSGNKRLQGLAGQRDSLAKRIADANKFASDTASKAAATGSLGSIVQPDAFSPSFVKKGMRQSLASIKQFTADVQRLKKRGISKGLLQQILELGPEQGAQFAASLARADAATLKQFNSLNSQIGSASSKLGKTGADLLFDSGKKAGQGFLTGLKAQQKSIEQLMLSIAKGMQKAIRRALGIKSPSRVMAAVGRMTVLGLHGGITGMVPAIDAAMTRVARSVASGVPTTLPALGVSRGPVRGVGSMRTRPPATSGPGEVHYHLGLTNHGVIGSQLELRNWLAAAVDDLNRRGRLPKPKTTRAA